MGFADLRRRVGVEDSGRFRYHLKQLRGDFVEKANDGYRLTYAGEACVMREIRRLNRWWDESHGIWRSSKWLLTRIHNRIFHPRCKTMLPSC
ncbi:DUF7347 domain-containing protein [Halalkalicoccus subterraneus]